MLIYDRMTDLRRLGAHALTQWPPLGHVLKFLPSSLEWHLFGGLIGLET